MNQNACRQADILIQQIQTTIKTLSSNTTAFKGVLDTGGKVLPAGACPGHSQFQLTHCRTQLSLSVKMVAPLETYFKKGGNVYISSKLTGNT